MGRSTSRPSEKEGVPGSHAPDPAVSLVTIRMAKTGLVMPDDRVGPVADIEGALRAEFHIHRTEATAGGFNQGPEVFETKAETSSTIRSDQMALLM